MQNNDVRGDKRKSSKKRRDQAKRRRTAHVGDEDEGRIDRHEIGTSEDDNHIPLDIHRGELAGDHENPDELSAKGSDKHNKIIQPKRFKNITNHAKRLIVVLEKANLEVIKTKTGFELLNTEDHQNYIKKFKKDPQIYRPDILHQCLLMLFDSPLNRAGLLQVYIHTEQNVLIEINPQTRFPRTFRRFAFLMVQLLHKLSIKASNTSEKLLRVIKNPVTDHLPVGCKKYGTSFKAPNLLHPREIVPKDDQPVCVVIGAIAHGAVNVDYTEGDLAISQYPLSAALACTKICSAFEDAWNIL